jgi:predicted lipoprotein with Yx(FWY)xxD motif
MPKQPRPAHTEARSAKPRRRAWLGMGALVAVGLVTLAATALGASTSLTLTSASNSALGKRVVVNPQGRTLYTLSPETSRHLLCKSRACMTIWPPLTVKSAKTKLKAGSGVKGTLAILRRSNGTLQVTLNGRPLYRYAGDSAKGQANGEGIESFGGIWHAVKATGSSSTSAPMAPSATTTPSTTTSEPAPYKY